MDVMLKHAADLADTNEYFIVWAGETNARPHGAKADAYSLFPEFELSVDGLDITADMTGGGHTAGLTTTFTATTSATVAANEWVGAIFRVGDQSLPAPGYGTIDSNTASSGGTFSLTVTWTVSMDTGAGGATEPCYIVREDRKWATHPQVRILTPYQVVTSDDDEAQAVVVPAATWAEDGRSVTLPAPYNGTVSATSIDEVGLLLPATFYEGIDGFGISDVADSTDMVTLIPHPITTIASTGTVWTFTTAIAYDHLLQGGYVLVDWEDGGVVKRSWAPITSSTTTTFTVGTWLGDGLIPDGEHAKIQRYTAWVPYFTDSPYAYLPGEGFTYPNTDAMPYADSTIGANVLNRPRGQADSAYSDSFSALLVAASRLSSTTGKRVNVVNLGIGGASLAPSNGRNSEGFGGQVGWWDQDDHGTWAPNVTTSVYARLDALLRTVLPNAMAAESNTKALKCLGVVFAHGESDAQEANSQQSYARTQAMFIAAVRELIDDLGYNPYGNGAEIPFVQPRIAYLPWGEDYDTRGLVNAAIEENTVSDEFAASVLVDDLPRLTSSSGIYNGVGAAALGARIGDKLALLIDHGLGFGSTALTTTQTKVIDICNLALSHIGDAGQITSLTDGSEQATLCLRFLPEARDELLQSAQWGFALRRRALVPVRKPQSVPFQSWEYCYVVPGEALFSFNVLGPAIEPSSADFDYSAVDTAGYSTTFVANGGQSAASGTSASTRSTAVEPMSIAGGGGVAVNAMSLLPTMSEADLQPQPFKLEQSPFGHRLIYTNQPSATLQYVARVVDANLYSPLFISALASNLASKLASVVIKGKEGEVVSARLLQKTSAYISSAATSDANQQRPSESQRPFGFQPDHLRHRYGGNYGTDRGGSTTDYRSGFTIN